jgi:hypothetical protein
MHEGAILGNHAVNQMKIAGHATEVVEAAARHEHHRNASTPRIGDSLDHGWIQPVIASDRAVVVQGEN